MTDLEELFSSAAELAEQGHPAPPDALARLAAARRARRHRAAWIGGPLAAALVATAVVIPAVLLGHDKDSGPSSLGGADRSTGSFVALKDGRAGVYDAADGSLQRDLGPAVAVAAGPDAVWTATSSGCDGGMLREVALTPNSASSEAQVGLVTAIAASPDGKVIAYSEDLPSATPDGAAPCGGSDLVLVDRHTGTMRRWSGHDGPGQIGSLTWSADSTRLAFQVTECCDGSTALRVLDPAAAREGSVDAIHTLAEQPAECQLRLPAYQGNQAVAVRDCQDRSELVAIGDGGRLTALRELPDNPQALAVRGETLLVEQDGPGETPGALLRINRDRTTTIGRGLAMPVWVPTAGGQPSQEAVPSTGPTASAAGTSTGVACTYRPSTEGSTARNVGTPPARAAGLPKRATIHTNRGDVSIALRADATPCTVNSFVFLAQSGYYDAVACHRLTTNGIFLVQCGDPTGRGTGGPGYTYADEDLPGTTYPSGVVAMANAGPDTNGSQFFLAYDDSALQPNYTAFGRIISGLDVLRAVAAGGSEPAADGKPKLALVITGITLG